MCVDLIWQRVAVIEQHKGWVGWGLHMAQAWLPYMTVPCVHDAAILHATLQHEQILHQQLLSFHNVMAMGRGRLTTTSALGYAGR